MLKLFRKKVNLNKAATVYFANETLILTANHQAPNGLNFIATPVIKIPISSEETLIGESVRKVLEGYTEHKEYTDLPNDMKIYMRGMLKELGFRSWKSLESPPNTACQIRESDGTITLNPLRKDLQKKNNYGLGEFGADKIKLSTTCNDRELGEALIKAVNAKC